MMDAVESPTSKLTTTPYERGVTYWQMIEELPSSLAPLALLATIVFGLVSLNSSELLAQSFVPPALATVMFALAVGVSLAGTLNFLYHWRVQHQNWRYDRAMEITVEDASWTSESTSR